MQTLLSVKQYMYVIDEMNWTTYMYMYTLQKMTAL